MKSVSDLKLNYVIQKIKAAFCPKDHTHNYAGSNEPGGNAQKADEATKLSTPRRINVDLSNNEDNITEFDGSGDAVGGVSGVLSVENGGTGCSTPEEFKDFVGYNPAKILQLTQDGYTGTGKPVLKIGFTQKFNPNIIIIYNDEMGGQSLILTRHGSNTTTEGLWGFGLNSIAEERLSHGIRGESINDVSYAMYVLRPVDINNFNTTLLQLYNATDHYYRITALGTMSDGNKLDIQDIFSANTDERGVGTSLFN